MVAEIIAFILGGICGIVGLAFIQAHRVMEFNERVRLWEESHLLNTKNGLNRIEDPSGSASNVSGHIE